MQAAQTPADADDIPANTIVARATAGRALTIATARSTEAMDSFSVWLIAGFAGAFTFLVGNLDSTTEFIVAASIRKLGIALIVAFAIAIVAKLIAMWIFGVTKAAIEAYEIGLQADGLNFGEFIKEMRRPLFWPGTWFADKAFKKTVDGDLAFTARICVHAGQIHSMLVVAQAATAGIGLAILVLGLKS